LGYINEWEVVSRYQTWNQADAEALYRAIADPQHGVLQWLKRHY
jgi:hypothetical protein